MKNALYKLIKSDHRISWSIMTAGTVLFCIGLLLKSFPVQIMGGLCILGGIAGFTLRVGRKSRWPIQEIPEYCSSDRILLMVIYASAIVIPFCYTFLFGIRFGIFLSTFISSFFMLKRFYSVLSKRDWIVAGVISLFAFLTSAGYHWIWQILGVVGTFSAAAGIQAILHEINWKDQRELFSKGRFRPFFYGAALAIPFFILLKAAAAVPAWQTSWGHLLLGVKPAYFEEIPYRIMMFFFVYYVFAFAWDYTPRKSLMIALLTSSLIFSVVHSLHPLHILISFLVWGIPSGIFLRRYGAEYVIGFFIVADIAVYWTESLTRISQLISGF